MCSAAVSPRPQTVCYLVWSLDLTLTSSSLTSCRAYVILFNGLHHADVTLFIRTIEGMLSCFDLWTIQFDSASSSLLLLQSVCYLVWSLDDFNMFLLRPHCCSYRTYVIFYLMQTWLYRCSSWCLFILAGPTGGLFSYDALTMSMRLCLILYPHFYGPCVRSLFDASTMFDQNLLPQFFGGFYRMYTICQV